MVIILISIACSNDEDENLSSDISLQRNDVTFLSEETDGMSVLIFDKKNKDNYKYLKSISSGWSADGKLTTILELGYYKFLIFKSAGMNTSLSPQPLDKEASFDDLRFMTKADTYGDGYVLPVDEIFLPDPVVAEQEYHIETATTVYSKLTRAVSQVTLNLNRGYSNSSGFSEQPFESGRSIMNQIAGIELDITGVGESINIYESTGSKKTHYSSTTATSISDKGFASFAGPFVFPSIAGEEAEVKITINPTVDSAFPIMEKTIKGKLEKNKKLEITLWMTSTYNFIDISVNLTDITTETDGDSGIWE